MDTITLPHPEELLEEIRKQQDALASLKKLYRLAKAAYQAKEKCAATNPPIHRKGVRNAQ